MSGQRDAADARRLGALIENADHGGLEAQDVAAQSWKIRGHERLLRTFRDEGQGEPLDLGDERCGTTTSNPRKSALARATRSVQTMALAAVVATVVSGLVVWSVAPKTTLDESAITFNTDDSAGDRTEGRVSALAQPRTLSFSDGTRLSLEKGAVLRVRETAAFGATLVVERGTIESKVVHDPESRWSFLAGPFEVKVIGTEFTAAWDPEHGKFEVKLLEGEVQILGAGIEETVTLRAGQSFFAHHSGGWRVSPLDGEGDLGAPLDGEGDLGGAEEPPNPTTEPEVDRDEGDRLDSSSEQGAPAQETRKDTTTEKPKAARVASWGEWVAQGKFELVLEAARSRGSENCLRSCSVAELRAWGDAARYSGRTPLAKKILLRLRDAAPAERARAGYLLGSLAESRGQVSMALSWYRRYVSESGGGALEPEARAGVMRCLLALGKNQEAERVARDYLRVSPQGVGAPVARQILGSP